jgi:hypothetical protein
MVTRPYRGESIMKKTIMFGLIMLMMIASVMATGWTNIYTETFESGSAGNPYACEYIMSGQPGCQDWLYSSQASDGILGVEFGCYTDSLCALPVNIGFQTEDYKITFYAKNTDDSDWLGLGMSDYDGSGTTNYNGRYMWWSSLTSYNPYERIGESSGIYESPISAQSSGVARWGTGWKFHEVYINSTCTKHDVYDTENGTLLLSGNCLAGPLPSQLNNKRLGLFLSQQGGHASYYDDVKVYEYVPCTPNWSCNGYASCLVNDTQRCNSVTDLNTCGGAYGGDYSEFNAQACDYCAPSFGCSEYSNCIGTPYNHKDCLAVSDANTCFTQTGLVSDQFAGSLSSYETSDCSVRSTSNHAAIINNAIASKQASAVATNPIEQLILNFRSFILGIFGIKG